MSMRSFSSAVSQLGGCGEPMNEVLSRRRIRRVEVSRVLTPHGILVAFQFRLVSFACRILNPALDGVGEILQVLPAQECYAA